MLMEYDKKEFKKGIENGLANFLSWFPARLVEHEDDKEKEIQTIRQRRFQPFHQIMNYF